MSSLDDGFASAEFKAYIASNARGLDDPAFAEETSWPDDQVRAAAETVADAIRAADGAVLVYTGAGCSCSAGLPSYRGKDGIWTRRARGESVETVASLARALDGELEPTPAHRAVAALVEAGLVGTVATTNIDGLHAASGLVRGENLAQLHGSHCVKACKTCGSEQITLSDTMPCPTCGPESGAVLESTIVGFFDDFTVVPSMEAQYDLAWVAAVQAKVTLVLGSSLTVETACSIPRHTVEHGGQLFICNLQPTPQDETAALVVRATTDAFMGHLSALLL